MILQPSKLVKSLGLPLVCLAMFSLGGGHWAILQSLAWGQMLWGYVQTNVPMVEAVTKTFNGENPCSLCTSVQEGRQQEQKAPAVVDSAKKIDGCLFSPSEHLARRIGKSFSHPPVGDQFFAPRFEQPPAPVPILPA